MNISRIFSKCTLGVSVSSRSLQCHPMTISKLIRRTRKRNFCSSSENTGVRVRFAPSPTGLLHLGGFRTALLNYLFALKFDGKFIVRIEDTDQTRLVKNASQMIEDDLLWLGIIPDESPSKPGSYGPYVQSQRRSYYDEQVAKLVDSGNAYECFCTDRRLDIIRKDAVRLHQKPRYDNKCRDLTRTEVQRKISSGEKYCIRFKLEPELLELDDLVNGKIKFDLTDGNYEADMVIIKSDGFPTYHFANVVDDHFMQISHVLRGVEWQISTPKHLQLYKAFGWTPPKFAHLPVIVNKDGTKLSKRQGDVSIQHYQNQQYYPKALTNFVTKSGGGFLDHGVDKNYDFVSLADMFELSKVSSHVCRLDFALLENLNKVELRHQIETNFASVLSSLKTIVSPENFPTNYLENVLKWCPDRISSINDLLSAEFAYLWSLPDKSSITKISLTEAHLNAFVNEFSNHFSTMDTLDNNDLTSFLKQYSISHGIKHRVLLRDLRMLLCGIEAGPPVVEILQLFRTQLTLDRLRNAISAIQKSQKSKYSAIS